MSAASDTTTANGEVIEGTAQEIVPAGPTPTPPSTLFRTDDPVEVIEQASRAADALKGVIMKQKLTQRIQGRDHVLVEGWTTLGSMLGVVPVLAWSRRVEPQTEYVVTVKDRNGRTSTYTVKGYDWEARVEARTLDGRIVGAAESLCSRAESTWAKRDDYALRSMAATRATSKALRGPLGFVITLAGFAATPAEEMPRESEAAPRPQQPPRPTLPESDVTELAGIAKQVLDAGAWDSKQLSNQLIAAGATDKSSVSAALRTLKPEQADQLKSQMVDLLAAAEVSA